MDENKNPESRYDVDEEEGATTVLRADRKSTRLNSSHQI